MTATDTDLADAVRRSQELSGELERQRTLGMAVGMVVERLRLGVEPAQELLVTLAETTGRDLQELAHELVTTGRLAD